MSANIVIVYYLAKNKIELNILDLFMSCPHIETLPRPPTATAALLPRLPTDATTAAAFLLKHNFEQQDSFSNALSPREHGCMYTMWEALYKTL